MTPFVSTISTSPPPRSVSRILPCAAASASRSDCSASTIRVATVAGTALSERLSVVVEFLAHREHLDVLQDRPSRRSGSGCHPSAERGDDVDAVAGVQESGHADDVVHANGERHASREATARRGPPRHRSRRASMARNRLPLRHRCRDDLALQQLRDPGSVPSGRLATGQSMARRFSARISVPDREVHGGHHDLRRGHAGGGGPRFHVASQEERRPDGGDQCEAQEQRRAEGSIAGSSSRRPCGALRSRSCLSAIVRPSAGDPVLRRGCLGGWTSSRMSVRTLMRWGRGSRPAEPGDRDPAGHRMEVRRPTRMQ